MTTQKNLPDPIAAGQSVVHAHTHVHQELPPPLLVSTHNAKQEGLGNERDFRKLARKAAAAGKPIVELSNGALAILRSDLEAFIRETGVVETSRKTTADDDELAKVVARSGLRMVSR